MMTKNEMIEELRRIGRALGDMQHELVVTGDQGLQVTAAQLQRRVAAVVDAIHPDEYEQVGWAVLKDGITSWRRIEEGTTGGGSQFWRDAEPIYRRVKRDPSPLDGDAS